MALDRKIIEQAKYWSNDPVFDSYTRNEVLQLIESNNEKELTDRFYRDLEFGTGGLRGILGAGTSRMNIYNIRKATRALAHYIHKVCPKGVRPKVAISYDSRRFSREFAECAAGVLAAYEIEALITKELRPVPMLSFMVRQYGCIAGICVTASHNPPEYNGFKVYWKTGGQIVPPHDEAVIDEYNKIHDYSAIKFIAFDAGCKQGLIKEIGTELDEAYFSRVLELSLSNEKRTNFKIVYTPLHGTGGYPVVEMLRRFGFTDIIVVPEQAKPDGNFPTVKSPNPEVPAALDLARTLAKKVGADLILATDPDCDRIGLEIKIGQDYFRPNGNQIGCLLTEYVLKKHKKLGKKGDLVIKTIVTTELQADIAKEFDAYCDETLTGFKWICQLIDDYETGAKKPKRTFICGGEESFGFLSDSFVRDKDAVIACCLAAEMVLEQKAQMTDCVAVLDSMFKRHGVYHETLRDLTLPGKEGSDAIKAMMQRLRNDPPKALDGIAVSVLKDYENQIEFKLGDRGYIKSEKLTLPVSNVLQFVLVDGTKVSVRPSGTEPKIKFYVSVKDPKGVGKSGEELKQIKVKCEGRAKKIEDIFVAMARGS